MKLNGANSPPMKIMDDLNIGARRESSKGQSKESKVTPNRSSQGKIAIAPSLELSDSLVAQSLGKRHTKRLSVFANDVLAKKKLENVSILEEGGQMEAKAAIFGNLIIVMSIAEGASMVGCASLFLVLNIDPTTVNSETGLSASTVILNLVIMLFFELAISDALVAMWSRKKALEFPDKYLDISKIWARRNKFSYWLFGLLLTIYSLYWVDVCRYWLCISKPRAEVKDLAFQDLSYTVFSLCPYTRSVYSISEVKPFE